MRFHIPEAKVSCPCVGADDERSFHCVSAMRMCQKCCIRRCEFCVLHVPKGKNCNRCKKEYSVEETHCHRCYTCPNCDGDLRTYPLSYKSGENGFELVKLKDDDSRIVGKSVFFKCQCGYKFNTKIETKPQSLQEIVKSNVQDESDVRFGKLIEFYDWRVNYYRILDRQVIGRWKSEILEKFSSIETAKVLKHVGNHTLLHEREKEMILDDDESQTENSSLPTPKRLNSSMKYICTTCLADITTEALQDTLPLVYAVPLIGYPSKNVREQTQGSEEVINVSVLVSFINNAGRSDMKLTLLGVSEEKFTIPRVTTNKVSSIRNVPSCLLSHSVEYSDNWKKELSQRDADKLNKIRYKGEDLTPQGGELVDYGDGWITVVMNIDIEKSVETTKGIIEFPLLVKINDAGVLVEYHCRALI